VTRLRDTPIGDRLRSHARPVRHVASRRPLALIAFGTVLYATGPVMVRGSSVSGPVFSFWRLWIGVIVLAVAASIHVRASGRRPDPVAIRAATGAGVVFGLHQLAFFTAIKLTSVADVTLIATLSPVVTGAIALLMFAERPARGFWAWSVLAMVGAGTVVGAAGLSGDADAVGLTLALLNVALFAYFFLLSKRHRAAIDVVPFLAIVMVVGAVTVSAYVLATDAAVGTVTQTDLVLAAATAIGPGFLGHFVMTWPLAYVPANVPPVFRLATPFLAGGLAWLFLHEPMSARHLLGGLLTIGGVFGAIRSRAGRELLASERGA
jgi:drug/metabolite transporter (DMT)-like permease